MVLFYSDKKQLKKQAERHERKSVTPSVPGALDVQALMDKAIEMRRKVIEVSDDDELSDEDDDDDWGSD